MAEEPRSVARPPPQVSAAEAPSIHTLTTLAVSVVVVAALFLAREVLIPITLAILLSFVLAPLVRMLRSFRIGRVPAVLLSVVSAVGVIVLLGGVIGVQLAGLAQEMPKYQTTIDSKIGSVREFAVDRLGGMVRNAGREIQKAAGASPNSAVRPPPAADGNPPAKPAVPVEVRQPEPSPLDVAQKVISPVLAPLATMGIVFVVAIFILLQQDDLRNRMIRLFGSTDLHRTTQALDDGARRLSRYFLTQLAVNATFGIIIGMGLWTIGVPSPVLCGIVAGLMRFVPYVGSVIAAVLALALAAAVDPNWAMVLWTGGLFATCEVLAGQFIEPMLYGHSTGLSPFAVVVAAIFWGWIWGPVGLILSTPLTLCLVVLGRHVDRLEFIDVLLGDHPALSPLESFYQRALAGDSDEAQDQAEQLLRTQSLSSYYDDVVLDGLRLAANDVLRGVVTAGQRDRINDVIQELVDGLDDYDDSEPKVDQTAKGKEVVGGEDAERSGTIVSASYPNLPELAGLGAAWQGESPVLCISGRGPLDDAPALIMAQLLRKHGLAARVAAYNDISRAHIGSLDAAGVAIVCLCYLDLGGSPTRLRYLVRRLRQRLPGAQVIIGFARIDDWGKHGEDLRTAIGADHYCPTLRAAVTICLQSAADTASHCATDERAMVVN